MSSASLCCAHLRALPFCAIVSVSMRVRTLHTHPHTHKTFTTVSTHCTNPRQLVEA